MRLIYKLFAFLVVPVSLVACSSSDTIDTSTPQGAFKLAEKYEKDERFEEAIAQFNQVKNKHPYSKLATESKMRIADIHYKREEFVEAQAAYQSFKELHPSHPQSDYVTYRLAMSFFNQLPATSDRDLAVAERAILYFDEVQQSFPRSSYAKEAAENKAKALKMLAEKELYIGDFYFKREKYESALGRYEGLLRTYSDSGFEPRALFGAAFSAYKTQDLGKARSYYKRLNTQFRDSAEAEKARRELGNRI